MEYTVQKLARLAGVSGRTLRYYHTIGLLTPARISESGYRIYGEKEVDLLQQILFYREMGLELSQIRAILYAPDYDPQKMLESHLDALVERRAHLDVLIGSVQQTIRHIKGEIKMSHQDKFSAFKKGLIDENERLYGDEIRKKYGDDAVDRSNRKLMQSSESDLDGAQRLADEIREKLGKAFKLGDPASSLAMEVCALHKKWLMFYWDDYSPEAHKSLAQTYVDDARFTQYYDQIAPGCARFLKEIIDLYAV
ncbi:MAG: MerR family transcriptional regulator [Oscillospiraceae bacterium]|jgi:DNA-binding transcriptional MerR regulator|nr:MerR family transcriptional regulator [Oscillospiraceae bacterium]